MERTANSITIIIPTTGETHRHQSLIRAIESVLSQDGVDATPLVVLNGLRYSKSIRLQLENMADIRFSYQSAGSLPIAIVSGRLQVNTPFFGFLDDDDEYLPGALSCRFAPFLEDSTLSVSVSNGFRRTSGEDKLVYESMIHFQNDSLSSLFTVSNWLASCGGLYRTKDVDASFFAVDQKFYEWTLVAFKLALSDLKIAFVSAPTFVINETEGSLSKSEENYIYNELFYLRLMSYPGAYCIKGLLRAKRFDALHVASTYYLSKGDLRRAWHCHFQSLFSFKSFVKYILYSRLVWRCKSSVHKE